VTFSARRANQLLFPGNLVKRQNKKYSAFQNTQISGICSPVPPNEGRSADRHDTSGWNAMDAAMPRFLCATTAKLRTAKSCGPGAATVASILREDIPQTTVTINAAHRGEHEGNRNTIAWGKPGLSG
jgi:hypothetical protein